MIDATFPGENVHQTGGGGGNSRRQRAALRGGWLGHLADAPRYDRWAANANRNDALALMWVLSPDQTIDLLAVSVGAARTYARAVLYACY